MVNRANGLLGFNKRHEKNLTFFILLKSYLFLWSVQYWRTIHVSGVPCIEFVQKNFPFLILPRYFFNLSIYCRHLPIRIYFRDSRKTLRGRHTSVGWAGGSLPVSSADTCRLLRYLQFEIFWNRTTAAIPLNPVSLYSHFCRVFGSILLKTKLKINDSIDETPQGRRRCLRKFPFFGNVILFLEMSYPLSWGCRNCTDWLWRHWVFKKI